MEPDGSQRALSRDGQRKQTVIALSRILGRRAVVRYRRDGKPEVDADVSVSVSHNAGLTLAVAMDRLARGDDPPNPPDASVMRQVGCDAEVVASRTADEWQLMLGAERFALAQLVARERGEDLAVSATRAWGAIECLRKIGRALPGPVTLGESPPGGWVLFRAGTASIATFVTHVRNEAAPVVFAILTEAEI